MQEHLHPCLVFLAGCLSNFLLLQSQDWEDNQADTDGAVLLVRLHHKANGRNLSKHFFILQALTISPTYWTFNICTLYLMNRIGHRPVHWYIAKLSTPAISLRQKSGYLSTRPLWSTERYGTIWWTGYSIWAGFKVFIGKKAVLICSGIPSE